MCFAEIHIYTWSFQDVLNECISKCHVWWVFYLKECIRSPRMFLISIIVEILVNMRLNLEEIFNEGTKLFINHLWLPCECVKSFLHHLNLIRLFQPKESLLKWIIPTFSFKILFEALWWLNIQLRSFIYIH